MRFHSTPESAVNLEITKLAFIETITSVAIYIGIGVYFQTVAHYALAIVVAPFMLLRTEESAEWGLRVYEKFLTLVDKINPKSLVIIGIFSLSTIALIPAIALSLRFAALAKFFAKTPIITLSQMPKNWLRQCFCTDFYHAPEMLPMEIIKSTPNSIPLFTELVSELRLEVSDSKNSFLMKLFCLWAFFFLGIIGYFPNLIYRVSFKATALAYAPLIWITHSTIENPFPLQLRLKRIKDGQIEKARRVFSLIVLTMLSAKIGLQTFLDKLNFFNLNLQNKSLIESLSIPASFPWWQFTLGTDAILTYLLFLFADAAHDFLETEHPWNEGFVVNTVKTVSFLRATLALATVSHFFLLALRELKLPPILQQLIA